MLTLLHPHRSQRQRHYTVPTFTAEPVVERYSALQRVVDAIFLEDPGRRYEADLILRSLAGLDQPTRILIILRYGLSAWPVQDISQLARLGRTDTRSVLHFLNWGLAQIAQDLQEVEPLAPLLIGRISRRS